MKQEWSELNKTMQLQIKKKTTFAAGIAALLVFTGKADGGAALHKKRNLSGRFFCDAFPECEGLSLKNHSLFHLAHDPHRGYCCP